MRYIVRRSFWDYEAEEKWLNKMSAKGYSLIECGMWRYVFEEDEPSRYIYRVALIDNDRREEAIYDNLYDGVEVVAQNKRFVYYRQLSSKGELTININKEAKRQHFERRFVLFYCLMIMQIALGISNILMAMNLSLDKLLFSILLGVVMIGFGMGIAIGIIKPLHRKMKRLRQDG